MAILKNVNLSELTQEIRARGYALIIFGPADVIDQEETSLDVGADFLSRNGDDLENYLVEKGNEAIEDYKLMEKRG